MKVKGNLIVDGDVHADNVVGGVGTVNFTDGTNSHTSGTLNVSNSDFYLSTNLSGQPVLNFKEPQPIDEFRFSTELVSSQTFIDFTIPSSTISFLEISYQLRTAAAANFDDVSIRFNLDNGANYAYNIQSIDDTGAITSTFSTGQNEIKIAEVVAASADNANIFSTGTLLISGCNASSSYTSTLSESGGHPDTGGGGQTTPDKSRFILAGGVWESTATVTSIRFTTNLGVFVSGCKIVIRGF